MYEQQGTCDLFILLLSTWAATLLIYNKIQKIKRRRREREKLLCSIDKRGIWFCMIIILFGHVKYLRIFNAFLAPLPASLSLPLCLALIINFLHSSQAMATNAKFVYSRPIGMGREEAAAVRITMQIAFCKRRPQSSFSLSLSQFISFSASLSFCKMHNYILPLSQ